MWQAPTSPSSPALALQNGVPSAKQLHGKEWRFGDPHTRYRFIKVLGTGHYGVTYLCSDLDSGAPVAIKALDKAHPEFERCVAVQEILVLAAVSDHPNVAALHEVWEDDAYIFIVMEACLGGELFDQVIERKYFTEADAASITAAILSVIQHCHSKGIIHRDLKPENFLLAREGELSAANLRAIDFGLSKMVVGDAICRSMVGSSYYVAPEVLRGAYSYEADAWSVGTITYILLSGFPPFWGSADQVIFHRILNKPVDFDYKPLNQVSDAAKDFISRLLDKEPSSRMSVSQALAHRWITQKASDVPLSTDIISRLQRFTHQNRVKCLLMTIAAQHLSGDEIEGLRKVFDHIDTDGDGEVSARDLALALSHAGLDTEQAGIAQLLAGMDLDHHGVIHVEEFIAAALDQRQVLDAKTVGAIFGELDRDHDGLVSVRELTDALHECHVSIGPDTMTRLMAREAALDSKGMVSAKSFSQLLLLEGAAPPLELEEWMSRVRQFAPANSFRQLALLVVARGLDRGEAEAMQHLFEQLDRDATETISLEDLSDAVAYMGKQLQVAEEELQRVLEALDLRHVGVIEYDAFLAACLDETHLTEDTLRAAFECFDPHGMGSITAEGVAQVLRELQLDESRAEVYLAAACSDSTQAAPPAGAQPDGKLALACDEFQRVMLAGLPSIRTQVRRRSLRRAGSEALSGAASLESAMPWAAAPAGRAASIEGLAGAKAGRPPLSPLPNRQRAQLLRSSIDTEPHTGTKALGGYANLPGPEPPSPISLMPRPQPPSPAFAQPQPGLLTAFEGQQYGSANNPPSPLNLLSPREPLSPDGKGGDSEQQSLNSQAYRPYASLVHASSLGSPIISLAPRPAFGSPAKTARLDIGLLSDPPDEEPNAAAPSTQGLSLQQILQQFSSSGYKPPQGRRASLEEPLEGGVERSGAVERASNVSRVSDVSESWLGSN